MEVVLVPPVGSSVVSTVSTVSTVPPEYWLAVATTAPVLALAMVLEARAIVRGWTTSTSRLYRTIQSVLWALPLLAFVVTEEYALTALRGKVAPSWVPLLTEIAIAAALATLVLAPAFDFLFRAQAELLARMLVLDPAMGLKKRRVRFKVALAGRTIKKKIREIRKSFDEMTDQLNEANARLSTGGVSKEDVESSRAKNDETRVQVRERREDFERLAAKTVTDYEGQKRQLSELQNIMRKVSKVRQREMTERLLPGPKSDVVLQELTAEIRQIADSLTSDASSADETTEQSSGTKGN